MTKEAFNRAKEIIIKLENLQYQQDVIRRELKSIEYSTEFQVWAREDHRSTPPLKVDKRAYQAALVHQLETNECEMYDLNKEFNAL